MIIKKHIKYFVIPVALLGVWLFFVFVQKSVYGLFSVSQTINSEIVASEGPLLKGQIISGKFTAQYNNLGLIAVRFDNFGRINNDSVEFRLKKEGEIEWLHKATVKTDQFQPKETFPFGFAKITDSRNKTYDFQIESLGGSVDDAISLYRSSPVVIAVYSYPTSVFKHISSIVEFGTDKVISQLRDVQAWKATVVYLQPLGFYLLWLVLQKKNIELAKYKFATTLLMSSIIIINVLALKNIDATSWMYFIILYSTLVFVLKINYSRSFVLAFTAFVIATIFISPVKDLAVRAASFGFIFLLVGFFQMLFSKSVVVNGEPELE